jgi:DNA-binding response OmpR family regulator
MNKEENLYGSVFCSAERLPPSLLSDDSQSDEKTPVEQTDSSVLIYSRHEDTIILLKMFLKFWGYAVDVSKNPENLLNIVENRPPRLVILDSIIPFEANLDMICRIRQNNSLHKILIVLLSGFSQPVFRSLSLANGADGFFVKPVDFDLLENFLRKNIETHPETRIKRKQRR